MVGKITPVKDTSPISPMSMDLNVISCHLIALYQQNSNPFYCGNDCLEGGLYWFYGAWWRRIHGQGGDSSHPRDEGEVPNP